MTVLYTFNFGHVSTASWLHNRLLKWKLKFTNSIIEPVTVSTKMVT